MADVADVVPPALDQTGNLVIWWVDEIADLAAVSVGDELGSAVRITHSFTPDGFPLDSTQGKTTDERLALQELLESLDKVQISFGDGLTYVDSTDASSAAVALKPTSGAPSKSGNFVVRRNVPNTTVAAAAQKGTVYPVTLGPQREGPLTGSGKFTIKQQVVLTGKPVPTIFAV